ncbi:MAG: hypothetical protein MN733_42885, partial [Nitrososphaera sp.]|nr:hypothetical protein [Nitrososphaera sp.]
REDIQSTVFLPIGIPSRRVGALFLNFRRQQTFSPTFCLVLEILRQIITPHLENARQIDEAYRGFGQTMFVLHDLLRESLGTSFFFDPYLDELKRAIQRDHKIGIEAATDKLSNMLGMHAKSIKTAYLKSALDHHRKLTEGLDNSFRSAAGWLEEQYTGRSLRWELSPPTLSNMLPYDLRLAISSIVVDAVHNAIHHGKASLVKVKVWREERQIAISMLSDGLPWNPEDPPKPYSEFGISARLILAHDRMKAEYCWNMEGRQLLVNIPILPIIDGRDPYDNETRPNRR